MVDAITLCKRDIELAITPLITGDSSNISDKD
jgi:hypothetical protein